MKFAVWYTKRVQRIDVPEGWRMSFRNTVLTVLILSTSARAERTVLYLNGGQLFVIDPQLQTSGGLSAYFPSLTFTLENATSSPWDNIGLRFDIGGFCDNKPHQWRISASLNIGWAEDHKVTAKYSGADLNSKLIDNCTTEIFKIKLVSADYKNIHFRNENDEKVDLTEELLAVRARQKTEAAKAAEDARKAAEIKAARLDQERKRQAAEQARLRATCAEIYRVTGDKRVSDLTVKEEQDVRACQALQLYPPR